MWGCSSRATVRASRTNRTASDGEGVSPKSTTFTATSRRWRCSRTRNTAANPPSPSSAPTVNSSPRACCNRWRNVEMSRDMADAKPRKARAAALGTAGLALVWVLGVWPPPLWWRDHWPRETAMMRQQSDGRTVGRSDGTARSLRSDGPTVRPTDLKDVSPVLQRMVIIGEDSRFRTHHGIDPAEIADALGADRGGGLVGTVAAAWHNRERLRGASTITQQLAKNLYLSASRNPLRKLKEAVTALRPELTLPKDRILELYLATAEWGPGVWGADAASRAYFGVPPSRLDETQAAALAATLPHPRTSTPTLHPERMVARRDLILARYYGVDVYIPPAEETDTLQVPATAPPPAESLHIEVPIPVDTTQDSLTTRRTDAQGRTADSGRDSLP